MYEAFFHLDRRPFDGATDPGVVHRTAPLRRARDTVKAALRDRTPLIFVAGEEGMGKTALLHALARDADLAKTHRAELVAGPAGDGDALSRSLLAAFGAAAAPDGTDTPMAQVATLFRDLAAKGRAPLVLIDADGAVADSAILAVCELCAKDAAASTPMQMVLAGGPGLRARIEQAGTPDGPALAPHQEIVLLPMTAAETDAGIRTAIRHAGGDPEKVFDAGAIAAIFAHTGGVPGRVDAACDLCLRKAFAAGMRTVDRGLAEAALSGGMDEADARRPKAHIAAPADGPGRDAPSSGGSDRAAPKAQGAPDPGGARSPSARHPAPTTPNALPARRTPSTLPVPAPVPHPQRARPDLRPRFVGFLGGAAVGTAGLVAALALLPPGDRGGPDAGRTGGDAQTTEAALAEARQARDAALAEATAARQELEELRARIAQAEEDVAARQARASATDPPADDVGTPAPADADGAASSHTGTDPGLGAPEDEAGDPAASPPAAPPFGPEPGIDLRPRATLPLGNLQNTAGDLPEAATATPAADLPALEPAPFDPIGAEAHLARALTGSDPEEVLVAFARAAIRGDRRAAYGLGEIHETGDGDIYSPSLAREWYAFAASEVPAAADRLAGRTSWPVGGAPFAAPLFSEETDGATDLVWQGRGRFVVEVAERPGMPRARYETPLSAARLLLTPETRWWRVRPEGAAPSPWTRIGAPPDPR